MTKFAPNIFAGMATSKFIVVAFLVTLISAQVMPLDPVPDPGCTSGRGILAGGVCCPEVCGECGGFGCEMRPGGQFCCTGVIMRGARDCRNVGPPCSLMVPSPISVPSPTPGIIPTSPPPVMPPVTPPTVPPGLLRSPTPVPPSPSPSRMMPSGVRMWKDITNQINGTLIRRADACFVMVRGRGYLLGGRGGPAKTNIFNPVRRTWTTGAAPPFQFHSAQCVVFKLKVFVPTSWKGPFSRETQNEEMLVYDVPRDRWSTRPGLPVERRRGAAAAVLFKNRIWVVGGARNGQGAGSTTVGFFDFYNLRRNKWVTNLPDLPIARSHAGAAVLKGRICVAGGRNGSETDFLPAVIVSTFCYNMGQKMWMNVRAPMPMARADAAYGLTCDGQMMVAGGERGNPMAERRVDLFNGMKWSRGPNLVAPRHGTGLVVTGCGGCEEIYIAAGQGRRGVLMKLDSTEVLRRGAMCQ